MQGMDKRGDEHSSFVVYMVIAIFVIAFMVIGYLYITSTVKYLSTYTSKDLHTNIVVQRFLYSPTCFAYFDYELNRAYPNIIEWRKFSDESLGNCIKSEKYAFRLALQNLDTSQAKVIQSPNWKNTPSETIIRPVLIQDGKIYRGKLTIDVQNE